MASGRLPAGTAHRKTRFKQTKNCNITLTGIRSTSTFTLSQHVGLEFVEEFAKFTSQALDDNTVSVHVRLHVLSMREDTRGPQATSEGNRVHHLTCELLKLHSSVKDRLEKTTHIPASPLRGSSGRRCIQTSNFKRTARVDVESILSGFHRPAVEDENHFFEYTKNRAKNRSMHLKVFVAVLQKLRNSTQNRFVAIFSLRMLQRGGVRVMSMNISTCDRFPSFEVTW